MTAPDEHFRRFLETFGLLDADGREKPCTCTADDPADDHAPPCPWFGAIEAAQALSDHALDARQADDDSAS